MSARLFLWLMIPILLLAFWLGARSLDTRPIWKDELHSIHDAGGDPDAPLQGSLWDALAIRNPRHAPGYFYALNVWAAFTGWQAVGLRALSLMFGLLGIAVTARIARDHLSLPAALIAAAVLATSAYYAYYMAEMRVYSLMALLAALDVWLYLRVVDAKGTPRRWLWPALLAAFTATLYSHYLAVFPLIALGVYHLLFVRKDRRWWQVAAAFALAGVLFLPWLRVFVNGFELTDADPRLQQNALPPIAALSEFARMFSNGAAPLMVALLALALLGLRRRSVRQILFVALVALIALIAADEAIHFLILPRQRYLVTLWPLFALAVAAGLMQLRRWPVVICAVLLIWAVFGVGKSFDPAFTINLGGSYFNYPVQRVAEVVRSQLEDGDRVLTYLPDDQRGFLGEYIPATRYYYQVMGVGDKIRVAAADRDNRQTVDQDALIADLASNRRLWISYSDPPPKTLARLIDALKPAFQLCASLTRPDVTVDLYVKAGANCPAASEI